MAISLKNLLLIAEETGANPDGSNFDQRSLGYGDDAPLIIKDLPAVEKETNGALNLIGEVTDNFVRGGAVHLAESAVTDVIRLGKLLITPNGLAWAGAQVALAATNPLGPILPKSAGNVDDFDEDPGFIGNVVNTIKENLPPRNRLTLPLSTLATVGTGAAGVRFRKDGLIDTQFENGFNYDPLQGGPKYESSLLEIVNDGLEGGSDFTLRGQYFNIFEDSSNDPRTVIKSYNGGPHSTFGIGETTIKRYKSSPYRPALKTLGQVEQAGYLPLFNQGLFELRQGPNATKANSGAPIDGYVDYRNKTNKKQRVKSTRIGLYKIGDPGSVDLSNEETNVYNVNTIDKISAASIFKRQELESFEGTFKDYIKFRIAVVDNENPMNDNVILFRALLDNLSDNYSGDWNSFKYNGRAENFYTYSGFDRKISFGFKVHVQTRWEQKPLWRKLNYLVAQTAPEYKNRRMRGVFSRLTIGDWMNEIPGFFTSVTLGWSTAYPWEIRYDKDGADKNMNEYPHILDVSCEFQPVHNFAPSNSPTTPFILPEIGVNNDRKYARQSDGENQDEFDIKGVAVDAEVADIDIVTVPEPPTPPPALNPLPTPSINNPALSNDIAPLEQRGLAL